MKLLNTSRKGKIGYKPSIEVKVDGALVGALEHFSSANIDCPQVAEIELNDHAVPCGSASFKFDVGRLEIGFDFMRLQGINFADAYDQMALDFPWHFVDPEEGDE